MEARAAKGCRGLDSLNLAPLDWRQDGWGTAGQRHLWRVVMPTIKSFPFSWGNERQRDWLAEALQEVGAPCLESISINCSRIPPLLHQAPRLRRLALVAPLTPEIVSALEEAIVTAGGPHTLFPELHELRVSVTRHSPAGASLFAMLARSQAFGGLRELDIHAMGGENSLPILAKAFDDGLFPVLEQVAVNQWRTSAVGFDGLMRALAAAPCAQTLRRMTMHIRPNLGTVVDRIEVDNVSEGLVALSAAITAGGFPSLVDLDLDNVRLEDAAVLPLISSLGSARAPTLHRLGVEGSGMTDRAIKTVLAALREGRLGGRLERLGLTMTTKVSWNALARALAHGRANVRCLQSLSIRAAKTASVDIATIWRVLDAAVVSCPALELISFSYLSADMKHALESVTYKNARGKTIEIAV